MNKVLSKFLNKSVMVYMDNLKIYSKTEKEHDVYVKEVLEALNEAGLH